ncbi:MAG: metal-dependent hydrolase [Acidobacteriota bacterium]|nr:metal-dependent hydrolase [Acidobacteriota bacterium]MDE3168644.1 metal-dependent hydrolase [Acidobacteriota bacterium]
MEPFTHAFTSLALGKSGENRLPRFGIAMLVGAGIAPDLDYASYLAGPGAFFRLHRSLFHSIAGGALLACALAAGFCVLDRRLPRSQVAQDKTYPPVSFSAALAVCAIGLAGHLLLDVSSGVGVQLFWPFRSGWYRWNLDGNLDPWLLLILVAGLLLPLLFRLVNEEVGDRRKGRGGARAAIVTLLLVVVYFGWRWHLHDQAVDLLMSREYHNRVALSAQAFPDPSAPFDWRGVAVTDNTIEEVGVSLAPSGDFDPDRSRTRFKPDDSAVLEAGRKTADARRFLSYATIPVATVTPLEDGYRFEIHDMRFASDDLDPANLFVRVDFDSHLAMRSQQFLFASSPNP